MSNDEQCWSESLRKAVDSGCEAVRTGLALVKKEFEEATARDEPFRRKSRAVTFGEKILTQLVTSLYLIEVVIRKLAGKSFSTEFLSMFQRLTADALALIERKLGQIPIPLPLPVSQSDGTGGLTVAMLLSSVERRTVESLLPDGIELAPYDSLGEMKTQIPPGRHPVMVGLGFNSDVRPVWKDPSFIKMNYLELTVGIPAVRLTEDFGEPRGPFFYIPVLLLNSLTPTLLGWAFGFKKYLKRLKAGKQSYQVSSLILNRPLLTAEVRTDPNEEIRFAKHIPNLSPWLNFLDKPIVTRTWWGQLKFTFFHWDWLYTPVTPTHVKVQAHTDEIPLITKGPGAFGSFSNARNPDDPASQAYLPKAYLMSVPWRLLVPFNRKVLRGRSKFAFWRRPKD